MQHRHHALIQPLGIFHLIGAKGRVDRLRRQHKHKHIRAFYAPVNLLLKVGAGGNTLLVKPGAFALGLQSIIQPTGKVRVYPRVGDKHIQRDIRRLSQALGNELFVQRGGLVAVGTGHLEPGFGPAQVVAPQ